MTREPKLISVQITFRNTEATEPLKNYATDKVTQTLQKFVHQDTEANLVLRIEKRRQIAEVSFHSDGGDFHNSAESEDMYKSIDSLVDSVANQLRRHKEKRTSHH